MPHDRTRLMTEPALPSLAPLRLGPRLEIDPPVVLAPMAGVTSYPFRRICYRFDAGLCVSEMVSSRGILEGHRRTWHLVQFGDEESPRSIQIFGNDPTAMAEAACRLRDEHAVDHIDINFGCPVPKVTKKGMGAATPEDPERCQRVIGAVVRAADPVPVTIKVRLGMTDERPTFLDSGRMAEAEGCAWITLHGRTAAQRYSGRARWSAIAELKSSVGIPVLGNGDIFEADDAVRMVEATGVDGVVIGRGCLGNPWLFGEISARLGGRPLPPRPGRDEVIDVVSEHFLLMRDHFAASAREAILRMRKLGCWYAVGFPGAARFRRRFQRLDTEDDFRRLMDDWREGRLDDAETDEREPVRGEARR